MSSTVKSDTVRIIIHAGPGLEHFTSGKPQAEGLHGLTSMMQVAAKELTSATQLDEMAVPELMVSTSTALLSIAKRFRAVAGNPQAVLSVATFSQNIVAEMLNIVCDAGLGSTLRICLYQDATSGAYSVHQLDAEGYMGPDWPYGVLHPSIDADALHELDFKAIHTPQPATAAA